MGNVCILPVYKRRLLTVSLLPSMLPGSPRGVKGNTVEGCVWIADGRVVEARFARRVAGSVSHMDN